MEPSKEALRTARLLRMKIHSMPPGKADGTGADHPANAKWLDEVCIDDALIIDREMTRND